MNYLLKSKTKKIEGRKITPRDLLTNQFTINIGRVKFWFQYIFRNESIDYLFKKDFICATFLVIVFQFINFQYLELFRERVYRDLPTEQDKINKINDNLDTYSSYNSFGTLCALSLLYSGLCKWGFNKISKDVTLPIDKWTVLDIVCGLVCVVSFNYTRNLSSDDILDQEQKQIVDYYIVAVLVVSWLRYFSYFLLIKPVSKLFMTLIQMLRDTISFMFIMASYLLLAASIFSTLFQAQDQDKYGSFSTSFRTMFDYTLGEYEQEDLEQNNDSHDNLMMAHIVISNIFLLNFLIAILSTVYIAMRVIGDFKFKANLYTYMEKYELARRDKQGHEQLVIHPAPLNLLTFFILPATFSEYSKYAGDAFSRLMFWFENIIMSMMFAVALICLTPVIFIRMLYHLFRSMKWYMFLWISLWWIIFGMLVLPMYICKDVIYFYKINCYEGHITANDTKRILRAEKKLKIQHFSNMYEVMRGIYIEMNRKKRKNVL